MKVWYSHPVAWQRNSRLGKFSLLGLLISVVSHDKAEQEPRHYNVAQSQHGEVSRGVWGGEDKFARERQMRRISGHRASHTSWSETLCENAWPPIVHPAYLETASLILFPWGSQPVGWQPSPSRWHWRHTKQPKLDPRVTVGWAQIIMILMHKYFNQKKGVKVKVTWLMSIL